MSVPIPITGLLVRTISEMPLTVNGIQIIITDLRNQQSPLRTAVYAENEASAATVCGLVIQPHVSIQISHFNLDRNRFTLEAKKRGLVVSELPETDRGYWIGRKSGGNSTPP
jgi:hypothetical protein